MMKKADFNFEWLLALVAGAAILFLAIYGASQIGDTMRFQKDTELAKKISILTDPMQAGFASSSMGKISFQQETRVNNKCSAIGFGKNDISVSTQSGVGKAWNEAGGEVSIHDKYIFSENQQGKDFYIFSQPFNLPFKVTDMILMTSQDYCFVNAPNRIKEDLGAFNAPNIKFDNCTGDEKKVCFSGRCDIEVTGDCQGCEDEYFTGFVEKNGQKIYFADNLIYPAIFSDKGVYDCNVRRLLYRTGSIAQVFAEKADLMNARDCGTNLQGDLYFFSSETKNATVNDLSSLYILAKDLENKNSQELCRIW